ncbi:MAG: LLM class flavin-dependent oxidoreductase [Acidobacteriota bacterium]
MIPFSVLDLSPIVQGGSASESFRNTLDLARHAERWGYHRYWLAEHHNMPGIASAATAVVIGHVAAGTASIRVGSGGVMLPNHSPLVVAEQFGTLESLFPGRIDLGLGRAPGTDPRTTLALRRDRAAADESFPRDVAELQAYFAPVVPGQAVRAVPGAGLRVPIWLLGSSLFSAQLAADLGLPFAFASHFAPDYLMAALQEYRARFQPSESLRAPYAMVGVNVVAAETDAEAQHLVTSLHQQWINLRRGTPGLLQPPVDTMDGRWSPAEKAGVEHTLAYAAIGAPDTVARRLKALVDVTHADELIVTGHIFDHRARLRSFEIVADVRNTRM